MKKENQFKRMIEDLAMRDAADKLVTDPDIPKGDKFVQFMDLVDLDVLYAELADTMRGSEPPSACQQVLMKLVEIYKPEIFRDNDAEPEVELVAITAKSKDDLREQLWQLVDEGKLPQKAAAEIFDTVVKDVEKPTVKDVEKPTTRREAFEQASAKVAELAKELGIPDEIVEECSKKVEAEFLGDENKPTIN